MSVWMRGVLPTWEAPDFADLERWVARDGRFVVLPEPAPGWTEFELGRPGGTAVVAGDVVTGAGVREEVLELEEELDGLEGEAAARTAVREHLGAAQAIVGLRISPDHYDDAVAAANVVLEHFEQRPGMLTQVDTVGWYDGATLVLRDPG